MRHSKARLPAVTSDLHQMRFWSPACLFFVANLLLSPRCSGPELAGVLSESALNRLP